MEKRRNKTFIRNKKEDLNRGYLLFSGEYQIYFFECVENIGNFTNTYKNSLYFSPSCLTLSPRKKTLY